jgi:hypothetical protein
VAVDQNQILQTLTALVDDRDKRQTDLIRGLNNALGQMSQENTALWRRVESLSQKVGDGGGDR